MTWIEWSLIVGVSGLLFGARVFRQFVGYRCPSCQHARLRWTDILHETKVGMRDLWICPKCDSQFRQGNWGQMEVYMEPES